MALVVDAGDCETFAEEAEERDQFEIEQLVKELVDEWFLLTCIV